MAVKCARRVTRILAFDTEPFMWGGHLKSLHRILLYSDRIFFVGECDSKFEHTAAAHHQPGEVKQVVLSGGGNCWPRHLAMYSLQGSRLVPKRVCTQYVLSEFKKKRSLSLVNQPARVSSTHVLSFGTTFSRDIVRGIITLDYGHEKRKRERQNGVGKQKQQQQQQK